MFFYSIAKVGFIIETNKGFESFFSNPLNLGEKYVKASFLFLYYSERRMAKLMATPAGVLPQIQRVCSSLD